MGTVLQSMTAVETDQNYRLDFVTIGFITEASLDLD